MSVRHRSTVAAIGTLLALTLTTVGRSPVEGPAEAWESVIWGLGIAAGLIAFVAAASVFADVAQRTDEPCSTELRADVRTDHQPSGHPT